MNDKRLYQIINILGLSIAITIAILVYSFVIKEIQTDSFHKNGKDIYRVLTKSDHNASYSATHCGSLAPMIAEGVGEVTATVRLWPLEFQVKNEEQEEWGAKEICTFADASFFHTFTFPLLAGTVDADAPRQWVVLSEKMARRYFGDANPIGKHIHLLHEYWHSIPTIYQVVGVMKNIPAWSTVQGDIFLDYRAIENQTSWYSNFQSLTFVQLNPQASVEETAQKINKLYASRSGQPKSEVKLQPLQNVYYDREQVQFMTDSNVPKGSLFFTRLLTGSTLLILFLASCNYVLIKIAQGHHRLRIFAIQRCFGAGSSVVWKHFFAESSYYFIFSSLIGMLLAWWLFPYFLSIISPQHPYPFPFSLESCLGFLLLLVGFIVFISSTLSYYFLKRVYAGGIKNSIIRRHTNFDIRKVLVVVSVTIFCLLLADAAIVHRQLNYITQKDLGYNYREVMSLSGSSDQLKNLLLSNPDILSAACGSSPIPETWISYFKFFCQFEENGEVKENVKLLTGDADYLDTYQIKLVEGENFDPSTEPTDEGLVPIIVNQQFIKEIGLEHPVGTIFRAGYSQDEIRTNFKIIGVVKDFHYRLLYEQLTPVGIVYSKGSVSQGFLNNDVIVLRYRPGKQAAVRKFLEDNRIAYADNTYEGYYAKENAFLQLIDIAAVIGIVIAGLGIFAFAVFYTNSRRKEVALRKINGATETEIQQMFNREFVKLTLYACVIGLPIAWYSLHSWLERFAYRVDLKWYFFLVIVLACLVFVLLVIRWQIRKIMSVNPGKYLREL